MAFDSPAQASKDTVEPAQAGESWRDKAAREAALVKSAAGGFVDAGAQAFSSEQLPETAAKLALAAGLGLATARFAPAAGLVGAVFKTGAAAGASMLALEATSNGFAVAGAIGNTWRSSENFDQNAALVRTSAGQFLFDSALMTAAAAPVARGLSGRWLPEERFPNQGLLARQGKFTAGETFNDWVKVGGSYREFFVHVPKNFDPAVKMPLVVGADGVLLAPKNPIRGMSEVNGMTEQSDKLGFIAMYAVPKPRFMGKVYSWNEPNGAVNFFGTRSHSDSEYMQKAMQKVIGSMPVDQSRVFGVGFSQGGLQLHETVGRSAPGTFSALASVHGTMTDKVAATPAGTRLLVIHSQGDRTLPYTGGTGGLTRLLERAGWRNTRASNPSEQVERYLNANQITGAPRIELQNDLTVRTWASARQPAQPYVQEWLLDGKYGHAFPGRPVGGSHESNTSRLNGRVADASVLDAKKVIFEDFFALKPAKAASGA